MPRKKVQHRARKGDGSVVLKDGVYGVRLTLTDGTRRWFTSRGYDHSDGKDEQKAHAYRLHLLGKMFRGELDTKDPGAADVTISAILDGVAAEYQELGRRWKIGHRIRKLKAFFQGALAKDVTADAVDSYKLWRKSSRDLGSGDVSAATINRDLAILRHAYKLAVRRRRLDANQVPYIGMLAENNVRQGFLEYEEYEELRALLPSSIQPILTAGFFTGMRVREILSMQWDWVDWKRGVVILPGRRTKNGQARYVPIPKGSQLRDELDAQFIKCPPDCPYVFFWHENGNGHMAGDPVLDFRAAWKDAVAMFGRPELLFHDLRRSAVKLMGEAGIPAERAMAVTGHLTRSVYGRYFISSTEDIAEVGLKVAEHLKGKQNGKDS